jgi:HSP20 family protein
MTIARWNPVRDMLQMREAMDRAFEDVYRGRTTNGVPVWQLPLDAYVTDDALVLQANIPGLSANDVEVLLEGDTLTIRGELKTAAEENKYLLHERATGKFERVLTINTPIDHPKVEADFDNGVLTLTLPKAEAVKPRQIAIKPRPVQSAN